MNKSCAFTGHRDFDEKLNIKKLESSILSLIESGIKNFYCGMAVGFDLAAAECVIKFKKDYGLRLIACVPCSDQDKYFSSYQKRRYKAALDNCDEVNVLAPTYFNGCMQMRDRFLVDHCDVLLCYLNKTSGGTYYTVTYAEKKNKEIIMLS